MIDRTLPDTESVTEAFREFVMRDEFPCLGARATLAQNAAVIRVFGSLADPEESSALARELESFGKLAESDGRRFSSLIAVFPQSPDLSETEFDGLLWTQLQQLTELDSDTSRNSNVSDNPDDANFSFRFMGLPYFVVGLCPASSRLARRFSWPALVFNPHAVFDRLREEGKYERLREMIRARDLALQGSLNPNLADFGEASEARQYSGLEHGPDWKCPFRKAG